jgi:hypothetical protein
MALLRNIRLRCKGLLLLFCQRQRKKFYNPDDIKVATLVIALFNKRLTLLKAAGEGGLFAARKLW